MSSVSVKQNSVSAKNKKQTFMRQSRTRKDITTDKRLVTEEQLIEKQVITPEDVILLPSITKR